MIDPPWHSITPRQLKNFASYFSKIDDGFVMVWVKASVLHDVIIELERFQLFYVENVTWVRLARNNEIGIMKIKNRWKGYNAGV